MTKKLAWGWAAVAVMAPHLIAFCIGFMYLKSVFTDWGLAPFLTYTFAAVCMLIIGTGINFNLSLAIQERKFKRIWSGFIFVMVVFLDGFLTMKGSQEIVRHNYVAQDVIKTTKEIEFYEGMIERDSANLAIYSVSGWERSKDKDMKDGMVLSQDSAEEKLEKAILELQKHNEDIKEKNIKNLENKSSEHTYFMLIVQVIMIIAIINYNRLSNDKKKFKKGKKRKKVTKHKANERENAEADSKGIMAHPKSIGFPYIKPENPPKESKAPERNVSLPDYEFQKTNKNYSVSEETQRKVLEAHKENKEMNQNQLAEFLSVSKATVSKVKEMNGHEW